MVRAWVYLLRCTDGSLYTGWTVDLDRRLARHRAGSASRYTASRLPVELVHAIPMPDHTTARREEARIKRLSRADKLALLRVAQAAQGPVLGSDKRTFEEHQRVCSPRASDKPCG